MNVGELMTAMLDECAATLHSSIHAAPIAKKSGGLVKRFFNYAQKAVAPST
jgi:hypothetical protein